MICDFVRRKINEFDVKEELLKLYGKEGLDEVEEYVFLNGYISFMGLRRKFLNIPDGQRFKYLWNFFQQLCSQENSSLEVATDLFTLFTPHEREKLKTSFPNHKDFFIDYGEQYYNPRFISRRQRTVGPLAYK